MPGSSENKRTVLVAEVLTYDAISRSLAYRNELTPGNSKRIRLGNSQECMSRARVHVPEAASLCQV